MSVDEFTFNLSLVEHKEFTTQFEAACAELADRYAIACENLTRDQLANAILQAIKCGDFQRLLRVDGAQQVTYIPFREEERLRDRIRQLEQLCTAAGIDITEHTPL